MCVYDSIALKTEIKNWHLLEIGISKLQGKTDSTLGNRLQRLK